VRDPNQPSPVEVGKGVPSNRWGITMNRTRRTRAGTVLVAIALTAGCGGAAQSGSAAPAPAPATTVAPAPDPLEQIVAASEATLSAGSARFTLNMDVTGGGNSFKFLEASGSTDFNTKVMDTEMSVAQQPGAPVQTRRAIVIGGTVYLQPAGYDRWFSADAAALGMAQNNPAEQIKQFRDAAKDVRDAGTAEVNGRTLKHYQLTLNPRPGSAGTVAPLPPGGFPADLYLDDQGRFARIESRTPGPNQATMQMTMELSDYGVPVPAQAPDPTLVDPMPR
jgi:hypothetical protein